MATLVVVALLATLSLIMRRRRAHRPRALALTLTLALPPTLAEQVHRGRATINGECTRCRGPWEACARGCVTRPPARAGRQRNAIIPTLTAIATL